VTVLTGRLTVGLAGPEDDADLRRLMRETSMPGSVSVSFAREPSFFYAAQVEGETQTVIAREPSGDLVAVFSRAVRPCWVHGAPARLAYLSALRVHPRYRLRPALLRLGFARARELHEADREALPYAITTIVSDNLPARRILEAGLPGLPRYRAMEELVTYAIPAWRRRYRPAGGLELRVGRPDDWEALVALQARWGRRHRFAPMWDLDTLTDPARARNLRIDDFTLAFRAGKLVGAVAVWDQNGFKQTVIEGYSGLLDRARGLVNVAAPVLGLPALPAPGEALRHAYLSHLAVDEDDAEVARAVLTYAHDRTLPWGYGYLLTLLAASHPLGYVVRSLFRPLTYRAQLYTVSWRPTSAPSGISHLEAATL
jgi:hypothetical protein